MLYGVAFSLAYDNIIYYGMLYIFGYSRCNPMDEFFLCDTPKNRSNILSVFMVKKFDADKVSEMFRRNGQGS